MTSIKQANYGDRRYATRHGVVQILNWWAERWHCVKDRRAIARLPDHLLRDIGLEHRIPSNHAPTLRNIWL
ncbi:DUF1127 domain-containing protein [Pseudohalocynthiibacter aestuariivivens]|jgi:uncharacterized protein YjiS (DUF1127 family)|uniref:DUF1127 domain-containing protein n=1 Tax=Pseudohalocynthiibacter aestuariivivens TaxID=1591409 RepID=A0ABV5J9S6_9RHOB|nr:DUF1127 domain-containing protein [Pseudohalocynthiibacter aestuariivivens]